MILSGSLDSVAGGLSRPGMFFRQAGLQAHETLFSPPAPFIVPGRYSAAKRAADERRTLGLFVGEHPVTRLREAWRRRLVPAQAKRLIDSRRIDECVGKSITLFGAMVAAKEVPDSKGGIMCFLSLEDEHSIFETVLFHACYSRHGRRIVDSSLFLLSGRVAEESGVAHIVVKEIERIA